MQPILIYDDTQAHCTELEALLRSLGEQDIGIAVTYEEASALLQERRYAVLFLDIELDAKRCGIDFAAAFQQKFPEASLVYITAHIKYCEEIFSTSPAAFLLKPFSAEKVRRVMQIVSQKRHHGELLTLHAGTHIIRIILDEVAYIETRRRHLMIFDTNGACIGEYYGIRLSEIMEQLPGNFLHCHQSILVNMRQIAAFSRYSVTLHCGTILPVSQSRSKAARQRYLEYLGDLL